MSDRDTLTHSGWYSPFHVDHRDRQKHEYLAKWFQRARPATSHAFAFSNVRESGHTAVKEFCVIIAVQHWRGNYLFIAPQSFRPWTQQGCRHDETEIRVVQRWTSSHYLHEFHVLVAAFGGNDGPRSALSGRQDSQLIIRLSGQASY